MQDRRSTASSTSSWPTHPRRRAVSSLRTYRRSQRTHCRARLRGARDRRRLTGIAGPSSTTAGSRPTVLSRNLDVLGGSAPRTSGRSSSRMATLTTRAGSKALGSRETAGSSPAPAGHPSRRLAGAQDRLPDRGRVASPTTQPGATSRPRALAVIEGRSKKILVDGDRPRLGPGRTLRPHSNGASRPTTPVLRAGWEPDPMIWDDQNVVINVTRQGPRRSSPAARMRAPSTSFRNAQRLTGEERGRWVRRRAGTSRVVCSSQSSSETVAALAEMHPSVSVMPAHCTGWQAVHRSGPFDAGRRSSSRRSERRHVLRAGSLHVPAPLRLKRVAAPV